jgi:hypothetical protein
MTPTHDRPLWLSFLLAAVCIPSSYYFFFADVPRVWSFVYFGCELLLAGMNVTEKKR